jgi:hypothetical protein
MYQLCARILSRETELLKGIQAAQKQVREAVAKREWADFDRLQSALNQIGEELRGLEGERKALFSESPRESAGKFDAETGEAGFYRFIEGLPPGEQRDLSGKYRELRMAGLRARIDNDNLLAYTAGLKTLVSAFIESAFPDRKGRVYSRSGAVAPRDMRSMVLSHSL